MLFGHLKIKNNNITHSLTIVAHHRIFTFQHYADHIDGVIASVPASCAVDRGFEPRSGQTKHHEIGICCFSANYAALQRKSKDWLARNQTNVSEWRDMSTSGLLFQRASSIKSNSACRSITKRTSSSSSYY